MKYILSIFSIINSTFFCKGKVLKVMFCLILAMFLQSCSSDELNENDDEISDYLVSEMEAALLEEPDLKNNPKFLLRTIVVYLTAHECRAASQHIDGLFQASIITDEDEEAIGMRSTNNSFFKYNLTIAVRSILNQVGKSSSQACAKLISEKFFAQTDRYTNSELIRAGTSKAALAVKLAEMLRRIKLDHLADNAQEKAADFFLKHDDWEENRAPFVDLKVWIERDEKEIAKKIFNNILNGTPVPYQKPASPNLEKIAEYAIEFDQFDVLIGTLEKSKGKHWYKSLLKKITRKAINTAPASVTLRLVSLMDVKTRAEIFLPRLYRYYIRQNVKALIPFERPFFKGFKSVYTRNEAIANYSAHLAKAKEIDRAVDWCNDVGKFWKDHWGWLKMERSDLQKKAAAAYGGCLYATQGVNAILSKKNTGIGKRYLPVMLERGIFIAATYQDWDGVYKLLISIEDVKLRYGNWQNILNIIWNDSRVVPSVELAKFIEDDLSKFEEDRKYWLSRLPLEIYRRNGFLDDALRVTNKMQNFKERIIGLSRIAHNYRTIGNIEKANMLFEQMFAEAKSSNNKSNIIRAIIYMAAAGNMELALNKLASYDELSNRVYALNALLEVSGGQDLLGLHIGASSD